MHYTHAKSVVIWSMNPSGWCVARTSPLALLGLTACAGMTAPEKNTATGTGVGAIAGAVLTGGSAIGTVVGAGVGGAIGSTVK